MTANTVSTKKSDTVQVSREVLEEIIQRLDRILEKGETPK